MCYFNIPGCFPSWTFSLNTSLTNIQSFEYSRPHTVEGAVSRKSVMSSQADAENTNRRNMPTGSDWSNGTQYPGWDIPRLTKTPWELERHKKNSTWRRSKAPYEFPAHIFKRLPKEVYDCIVAQLEQIHIGHDQASSSCYLNDLYNLSLTSRMWDKTTTAQM